MRERLRGRRSRRRGTADASPAGPVGGPDRRVSGPPASSADSAERAPSPPTGVSQSAAGTSASAANSSSGPGRSAASLARQAPITARRESASRPMSGASDTTRYAVM